MTNESRAGDGEVVGLRIALAVGGHDQDGVKEYAAALGEDRDWIAGLYEIFVVKRVGRDSPSKLDSDVGGRSIGARLVPLDVEQDDIGDVEPFGNRRVGRNRSLGCGRSDTGDGCGNEGYVEPLAVFDVGAGQAVGELKLLNARAESAAEFKQGVAGSDDVGNPGGRRAARRGGGWFGG